MELLAKTVVGERPTSLRQSLWNLLWRVLSSQFARYGYVALVAGPVYWAFYIGLTEVGIHYLASSLIGAIALAFCKFPLKRLWVFYTVTPVALLPQLSGYLALETAFFGANSVGLAGLIEGIGFSYIEAQLFLTFALGAIGFVICRTWIFISRKRAGR